MTARTILSLAICGVFSVACATSQQPESEHAGHGADVAAAAAVNSLPADEAGALARLTSSPRHGEWVTVRTGAQDSVRAWVVYPERKTKGPVVLVVHEIFGLTPWIRNVADQLAAEGFIAVAPDLLTMKNLPGFPDSVDRQAATAAIRTLQSADVQRQLSAVAEYAMNLPSATKKYGIVGFCWGGAASFQHAASAPKVSASVVYYGAPPSGGVTTVGAPVLGLYGGIDTRINVTIPATDSAMKAAGKTYLYHIYPGAGHGFLRQQSGSAGANATATAAAWPETISWFRKHLGK